MASLWTGLYPVRTGVIRHSNVVPEEAVMPAEIFRDAGYATAGIWRNGWVAHNFGFAQGFEVYQLPRPRQAPKELLLEAKAGRIDGTDIDAIFSAVDYIRANLDRKFFLYMHLMDIHQYVSTDETAILRHHLLRHLRQFDSLDRRAAGHPLRGDLHVGDRGSHPRRHRRRPR